MAITAPIFVSHGAPDLLIRECPARQYLIDLGQSIRTPQAIVIVSAHWGTSIPTISSARHLNASHDFGGFEPQISHMHYRPTGAIDISRQIVTALKAAQIPVRSEPHHQLDHGAWIPLKLMYPNADIPVVQLSIQPVQSPCHHWSVGCALAALLQEGVLILASGGATHNLSKLGHYRLNEKPPEWVEEFSNWLIHNVKHGNVEKVANFIETAPFARENHPSLEHLLPLFVAWGAGGRQTQPKLLHSSFTYGVLSMASFEFPPPQSLAIDRQS